VVKRSLPCVSLALLAALTSVACATSGQRVQATPPPAQVETSGPAGPDSGQDVVVPVVALSEPDRPDVTNGTNIVDPGLLQLEIGVQHTRMGTQRNAGTPLTFRMGLFDWLEARAGTDGFLHQSDSGVSVNGMGNVQIGAKVRLFADPGGIPILSILPTVNLPVASESKGLGSGDADVTVALLTGTDLGSNSRLDVNYGIGAIGAGGGRPHFTQHLVAASLSYDVTPRFSPYVEAYGFSRQDPDGGAVLVADMGFIQSFSPRLALDGGAGFGLTQDAPDVSVFVGVSVVLGDVLGGHGVTARQRKAARLRGRSKH
jgi:hypothetical protein